MKNLFKIALSSFVFAVSIGLIQPALLQAAPPAPPTPQQQACTGAGGAWDPATSKCASAGGVELLGAGGLVGSIINTLLVIVGAASVIMMIVGGIRYIISSGDQNAVTSAKNTIMYAVIGLVVALLAYALVSFILNGLAPPPPAP